LWDRANQPYAHRAQDDDLPVVILRDVRPRFHRQHGEGLSDHGVSRQIPVTQKSDLSLRFFSVIGAGTSGGRPARSKRLGRKERVNNQQKAVEIFDELKAELRNSNCGWPHARFSWPTGRSHRAWRTGSTGGPGSMLRFTY
jgi:hypothetical protein